MLIGRKSPLTGQLNHREIEVTPEQLKKLAHPDRPRIQVLFPDLGSDDREFLLSGYTPEDWAKIFPPEGEE